MTPLYHVELKRPGANRSEFEWCIYGPSESPHPYESFRDLQAAQSKCEIINLSLRKDSKDENR